MAQIFRMDPDRDLEVIASYLRPDDVFIDVGGGAGRVCLPLAQRYREVVMVEPSPGMGAEFDAIRKEAGIHATPVGCRRNGWTQQTSLETWCLRAV